MFYGARCKSLFFEDHLIIRLFDILLQKDNVTAVRNSESFSCIYFAELKIPFFAIFIIGIIWKPRIILSRFLEFGMEIVKNMLYEFVFKFMVYI
jgi:hypothetical protein